MCSFVSRMLCSAKLLRSGALLIRDRTKQVPVVTVTIPGPQRITACCAAPGIRGTHVHV